MKSLRAFRFLFLSFFSFSQDKETVNYSFDYFSTYSYQEDEADKNQFTEINFSNSRNTNYHLTFQIEKNGKTSANLYDFENKVVFNFKDADLNSIKENTFLKESNFIKMNFESCIKNVSENYYEVQYKDSIVEIVRYKNRNKKRIINNCILKFEESKIVENQLYNVSFIRNPLWCQKFTIKYDGILKESYFIKKNKKINIRKLIEIKKSNLNITIDLEKSS